MLLLLSLLLIVSSLAIDSPPSCPIFLFCSFVGCSIGTIRCVNMAGLPLEDRRSRYYQQCTTGQWSGTTIVPDNKICYLGQLFSSDFCGGIPPQPECSFSGFQCYTDNNVITSTECTSRYSFFHFFTFRVVLCQNGFLSSPIHDSSKLLEC